MKNAVERGRNDMFNSLDEKRQRICEAAIEIFSAKSFESTTVSEIATAAQVGKGTFYLYFKSKDELLEFLIEHGIERLATFVKEQAEMEVEPVKKLQAAISGQLYFINQYRDYCRFLIREVWSYHDNLRDQILKLRKEYVIVFERILKEGMAQQVVKNVDLETVAAGLVGFISIATLHWLMFSDEFPIERIEETIEEVFLKGILLANGSN